MHALATERFSYWIVRFLFQTFFKKQLLSLSGVLKIRERFIFRYFSAGPLAKAIILLDAAISQCSFGVRAASPERMRRCHFNAKRLERISVILNRRLNRFLDGLPLNSRL